MGGNTEYIAGHGYLSLGQAVHVAQNSEGGVDQQVAGFLERKLAVVWAKLNAQPTTYVLPSDEFALLNYYRTRFGDNEINIRYQHSCTIPLATVLTAFACTQAFILLNFLKVIERMRNHFSLSKDALVQPVWSWKLANSHRVSSGYQDKRWFFVSLFLMLIAISQSTYAALLDSPRSNLPSLSKRAANESSLLQCLQVAAPVPSPKTPCRQVLMVHTFAYSYGQPYIAGDYNPPDCDFNHVIINFTVTSAGRQFDRLALMYFDDTEVFRTSTAEPTRNGIVWSYLKDMSLYLSLFKTPHKIIFDLGNLVDDTYTGIWNTTLTATFYSAAETFEPADLILPISAGRSTANQSSAFTVPETSAIKSLTLPQNARKAVFSISACGQSAEEFWWSNVLSSDTQAFGNDTTLYGHSPFRELQLLIDGVLAGVAWPFPVIFTGGVVPGFWRPIVGIDTFDLREDEIDISPFLPLLTDKQTHSFEIRVVGIDNDGKGNARFPGNIESNWVVTGKIFLWLDANSSMVTGTPPVLQTPDPAVTLHSTRQQTYNGTVQSLEYAIQVSRQVFIQSTLHTSGGNKTVTWQQNLTFANSGVLDNEGNDQDVRQTTAGTHRSSSGFLRVFEYPLSVVSAYNAPSGGNVTIKGEMDRGKNVRQINDLAFPNEWKSFDYSRLPPDASRKPFRGSLVENRQNGTASYFSNPAAKVSYGTGNTEQLFTLTGVNDKPIAVLYRRHIIAANDSIVYDDESLSGQQVEPSGSFVSSNVATRNGMHKFAAKAPRVMLGRGPR
ncbi:hypothetical protein EK21DRAFT_76413 [Setomelanomma holmii]|uniref:Peptide N-acetyl-beta-D-glucosaminyl asparaginase amidase A N-terminal domain-containing protein n=1 Tax=Setomelanomma holmii TaxID=210430 RepID=A0A9P4H0A8_9PLEO|nr:hypothetical protein EK21DRAFT_76413 [Setomelanomma holmii]